MKIHNQVVFLCYGKISEYLEELDSAAQNREICTLIAPGGTGKSALVQYWRDKGSRLFRPTDIVMVPLVPAKDSYKSATHMLYACMLDALQKHSPPAYVPRRLLRRYDLDYHNNYGAIPKYFTPMNHRTIKRAERSRKPSTALCSFSVLFFKCPNALISATKCINFCTVACRDLWRSRRGSNPQPSAPEADALSN